VNRASRAGYQVAFVAFKDGKPSSAPVPFFDRGWCPIQKVHWFMRPVGVTTPPMVLYLFLMTARSDLSITYTP